MTCLQHAPTAITYVQLAATLYPGVQGAATFTKTSYATNVHHALLDSTSLASVLVPIFIGTTRGSVHHAPPRACLASTYRFVLSLSRKGVPITCLSSFHVLGGQGTCTGMDIYNATRCLRCSSSCGAGQYMFAACDGTSKSPDSNDCRSCTPCSAGQFISSGACRNGSATAPSKSDSMIDFITSFTTK